MERVQQVVTTRWIPILTEYERMKQRVTPRKFRFVDDVIAIHRGNTLMPLDDEEMTPTRSVGRSGPSVGLDMARFQR